MPTEEEIIQEVLKYDPDRQQKPREVDPAIIQEVLKFDPDRVGGTYQPKPSPFPGGTPPVSAVTGKPETQYVPGEEPGASMGTLMKTVFADDPRKQIDIYAKARGIDPSRYRIHNGEIIFRNKAGKWQRETGELPTSLLKQAAAQSVNPAVIGGTLGAVAGGPKGAVAGAAGGELIRQAIGGAVYGDFGGDVDVAGVPIGLTNVAKVVKEGAFALASEIPGVALKARILGHRLKKTGLKAGSEALRVSNLTTKDHLKAEIMRQMAQAHNIDLPLHQAYDKASLENFWMYLRKHPATADKVKEVEAMIAQQSDEAVQGFVNQLRGGILESPAELGEQAQKIATKSIEEVEQNRASAVYPMYVEAFEEAARAGGVDTTPVIKQLDGLIKSYPEGPSKKALQRVKASLGTEEKITVSKGKAAVIQRPKAEQGKPELFRSWVRRHGGVAVDDPSYVGEIRDISRGAKWGPGVLRSKRKGGNMMDELLTKIHESGEWRGVIESENDILEALTYNPVSRRSAEAGTDAEFLAQMYEGRGASERGREWMATRKQLAAGTLPKSVFTPETDLQKIQKAIFDLNDLIEGTSHEAAQISPSSKNVLVRDLMSVKTQLLEKIGEKAPTFLDANARFAELSEPIDVLKRSVVGEISRLQKDKTTALAAQKLFNVTDAELVRRARASLEPQDPDLWRRLVGGYINDVYSDVKINNLDPLLAFGEFRRKIFRNPKQQEIMEAALGKDKFKQFSDLMTVLNRVTAGTKGQSMTKQFDEMGRVISGSRMLSAARQPLQAAAEMIFQRWNDSLVMGRHMEMLDAMLSKDAVRKLSSLKQITPGSRKLIDGVSEYLGMVIAGSGVEEIGNRMPGEQ